MDIELTIVIGTPRDYWPKYFLEAIGSDTLAKEIVVLVEIFVNFGTLAEISRVPVVCNTT